MSPSFRAPSADRAPLRSRLRFGGSQFRRGKPMFRVAIVVDVGREIAFHIRLPPAVGIPAHRRRAKHAPLQVAANRRGTEAINRGDVLKSEEHIDPADLRDWRGTGLE